LNAKWRIAIAKVEIVGGMVGVISAFFLAIWLLWTQKNEDITQIDMGLMSISLISMVLFLFSLIAGFLLRKEHRLGYPLTVIVQALQIPVISSADVTYSFVSGLQLGLGIGAMKANFLFYIGGLVDIGLSQDDPFFIGINIIPILFLWKLYKEKNMEIVSG